jgi:hypothetical protein
MTEVKQTLDIIDEVVPNISPLIKTIMPQHKLSSAFPHSVLTSTGSLCDLSTYQFSLAHKQSLILDQIDLLHAKSYNGGTETRIIINGQTGDVRYLCSESDS